MALMECPDCAGALSSAAVSCPHCGYRQARLRPRQPVRGWPAIVILAAYAVGAVALMYAMPNYAVLLGALAIVCALAELRTGLFRRALGSR